MQKKIKLLHITSSLKIGGAEAVLCDLVQNMDHALFEHHVIYFHDGPHRAKLQEQGIAVHHIKGALFLYDPLFIIRLYRIIKEINPDCIHSLLWSANIAGRIMARLLGIPIVCAMHNNVDQDGRFRGFLDSMTLPLAHKLIAVSPGVAQSIRQRDTWLPVHKIVIIQNGIDIDQLHKNSHQANKCRNDLGLEENHFIIGSVGRFEPVKRYDLMLDSFAMVYARNVQARLVLVGVGSCQAMLRKQTQTLGIEDVVIFVVGQPAYGYYPLFDCFVMSSDKEGISIALLEAMSFSLPCVVTNSESHHPVLHNGINGIIVQAGNALALAQACEEIEKNALYAKALGAAGYQSASQEFSSKAMVCNYEREIEECLGVN